MTKRQNSQERVRIVEKYFTGLTGGKLRLVCFLFMRNMTEREIRRITKLTSKELDVVKMQIAIGLRQAGIRLGDEEC